MTLRLHARRTLFGANIYAQSTVLRLTLAGVPEPGSAVGVTRRARRHFPALADGDGDDMALLVARVALALLAPHLATPGRAWCRREAHHEPGTANVVLTAASLDGTRVAARFAVRLVAGWLGGDDESATVEDARAAVARAMPTPSVAALMAAAERRGVPARPVGDRTDGLVIGTGAHATLFFDGLTPLTPATAEVLTRDRLVCLRTLFEAGVPALVPVRLRGSDEQTPVPLPAELIGRFAGAGEGQLVPDQAALDALREARSAGLLLPAGPTRALFIARGRVAAAWIPRAADSAGGALDVEALTPEETAAAVATARVLGLPFAEVRLREVGGRSAVCAVEARAKLPWPSAAADAAAEALLNVLHPRGRRSEARVVAVLEPDERGDVAQRLAQCLEARGHAVSVVPPPTPEAPDRALRALGGAAAADAGSASVTGEALWPAPLGDTHGPSGEAGRVVTDDPSLGDSQGVSGERGGAKANRGHPSSDRSTATPIPLGDSQRVSGAPSIGQEHERGSIGDTHHGAIGDTRGSFTVGDDDGGLDTQETERAGADRPRAMSSGGQVDANRRTDAGSASRTRAQTSIDAIRIVCCTPASVRDYGLGIAHCELCVLSVTGTTTVPGRLVSPEDVVQRAARRSVTRTPFIAADPSRACVVASDDDAPDQLERVLEDGGTVVARDSANGWVIHRGNHRSTVLADAEADGADVLAQVAAHLIRG